MSQDDKDKKRKGATKEEGVVWLSSSGGYYTEPEITADKLHDLRHNIYGKGLARKQKNLIFTEKFSIEVIDKKGDIDEDLQKTLTKLSDSVQLWTKMQMAFADVFWDGIGIFNPVWGNENNEYTLQNLRHLPARSFDTQPSIADRIWSQVLQGIILNAKGEIEYWQTNDDATEPVLIKNVFTVKEPDSTELAGEPIILPLVPILEMLKFTWNAQMQRVNRTGAPIILMRITNPEKASIKNGNMGDVEYGNLFLKHWGKDNAYNLRGNMETVDPHITDTTTAIDTIDALNNILIDYLSPASFISTKTGQLIGGTDRPQEEILQHYIRGVHNWLEDAFALLLNQYLEYNHYEGYTVRLHIPEPTADRSELKLKQAVEGFKAKSLLINELRERFDAEKLDEEGIEELIKLYERLAPKAGGFEAAMETATEITLKKETPEKVEKSLEEELKETSDKLENEVIKALENEEK